MDITKTSNRKYQTFIVVAITGLIVIVLLSFVFAEEKERKSTNYNTVFSVNQYNVKINDAMYNTSEGILSFKFNVKSDVDLRASRPEISEVFIDDSLDYVFDAQTLSEYTQCITIYDVPKDFYFIRLKVSSKEADIQPKPTIDEFGDTVTYAPQKGKESNIYVYIDYRDVDFADSTKVGEMSTEPIKPDIITEDKPQNTLSGVASQSRTNAATTPSATASISISASTPKVTTTTTKKTSQKTTQRTATTSKESAVATKPTTSEKLTATKTPVSTSKITTTTKAASTNKPEVVTTTTTTGKKTTTSKKVTTTTTTKKATTTTTTTKKVTTTKKPTTTTKKVTTTTVYIKLTGLALLEKGSEELLLGQSVTLTPVYTPSKATNKKVYWKSNRTDRVVVDSNGKCTAVGTGSAIITCTSDDGGLTAAYMITGVDG